MNLPGRMTSAETDYFFKHYFWRMKRDVLREIEWQKNHPRCMSQATCCARWRSSLTRRSLAALRCDKPAAAADMVARFFVQIHAHNGSAAGCPFWGLSRPLLRSCAPGRRHH